MLTDGVNSEGRPPQEAAQLAADRGVRSYTIGFGTENGDSAGMACGGRFGGGGFRRGIVNWQKVSCALCVGARMLQLTTHN